MKSNLYRQPEKEINLKEVIWDILSQWKALLIVSLIVMLIVTGARYIKDIRSYEFAKKQQATEIASGTTEKERISSIIDALPREEQATVAFLVNQNKWIETEKEYINNSILMNTNPLNQRTLLLDYYISMSNVDESKMTSLVYGYAGYLNNESFIDRLGRVIDPGAENKYIAELIRVNGDNNGTGNSTGNGSSLAIDSDADGAVIEICVVLPDDTDATAVETEITSSLTEYGTDLDNKIANHSISLIKTSEAHLYNSAAVNNHNNTMISIYNMQNNARNMLTFLTDEQRAAIEDITAIMNETQSGESETIEAGNVSSAKAVAVKPGFSKKYALLGFVLGVFLYCFAYLLYVILGDRFISAWDAEHYTQSRLLGETYKEVEFKGIRKLFHSKLVNKYRYRDKLNTDVQVDGTIDLLMAVCEHLETTEIALIDLSDTTSSILVKELVKVAASKGLNISTVVDKQNKDEKKVLESRHAIFVTDSKSNISEAVNYSTLCYDFGVKSVGSIFVGIV